MQLPRHGDRQFIDRYGALRDLPAGVAPIQRMSAYGLCRRNNLLLLTMPVWANQWELPGGGIDDGETPIEAAVREFLEETGAAVRIDGDPLTTIRTNFYADDVDEYWESTFSFYAAQLEAENVCEADSMEVQRVGWLAVNDALMNMHCAHAMVLREFATKQD